MSERKGITIDIGCGPKNNLDLYNPSLREPVLAIDSNIHFLHERNGDTKGNLILADAHHLPIKSGVADRVFLTHVLEHVNKPIQALREIERITHAGSHLSVAVPDSVFESVMSKLDQNYHSSTMHQRVLGKHELEEMLKSHGFETIGTKTRGFITALTITFMYFWHLKIKRDRKIEDQSGRLIGSSEAKNTANEIIINSSTPLVQRARIVYHSLENHPAFGKLFFWNKIYPFENFIQAVRVYEKADKLTDTNL